MKLQLPVPNMSQFAKFIFLYTFNVALDNYSEQNNLLMGGGVPQADFLDVTYITICIMLSRLACYSSIIYSW